MGLYEQVSEKSNERVENLKRDNARGDDCNYVLVEEPGRASVNNKWFENKRKMVSTTYYEKYGVAITLDGVDRELIDVFFFPTFVGGKHLDLSQNHNIFLCAPNGFGKSTLLKAILFATNPPDEFDKNAEFNEKIVRLKKHYHIEKDYLTLFIDLQGINSRNAYNNATDLHEWLRYASHLDNMITLADFKKIISHYNKAGCLMLLFDSIDEIIKENETDISREGAFTKIRQIINADGLGSNAKIIVASRPLAFEKVDESYIYLYIESLITNRESVEAIIEKYSQEYKDRLIAYIYNDLYLKNLVVTPQLLIEVISRIVFNWRNEESGISGEGKYQLIKAVIRNTMMRFKNKGNFNYAEKNYEHVYEIFSYISLFNRIENTKSDFGKFQDLILNNQLVKNQQRALLGKDIKDTYEHFCLFNTQGNNIELLAPKVIGQYYLASYMYKFCILLKNTETYEKKEIWKKFDTILNKDDCLYDMLVFFFGIMHDGITESERYNPDSLEYNIWIDYVVDKWSSCKKYENTKEKLSLRLRYLLESDFVKDSCFKRILESESELSENEAQLKLILNIIN